ncbi:MAG: hypothetical protein Q9182_007181 [Xanthomendoza sp. 2 TL-2023]
MEDVSPSSTSRELESPSTKQHRKSISTGGGRAWSHEEENYLIETRMHKMPYKHIATTLKKTELACRLHYHQLSFGSKRRRRTASATSFPSCAGSPITLAEGRRREIPQQSLPSLSWLATPIEAPKETIQEAFKSPQSHIPILPKPTSSRPAPPSTRGLRLITEGIEQFKKPMVDPARLDRIYDAHRLHFWSMIARSYGGNHSPTDLEQAWCKAHSIDGSNLPPTPTASPDESSKPVSSVLGAPFSAVAEYSKGFTSINRASVPMSAVAAPHGRSGSFAIANLLTEDKEEGVTKVVDLSADSLPLAVRMMKYFYVLDYEDPKDDDLANDVTDHANHHSNNDVTDEKKEQMDDSVVGDGRAQFGKDEAALRLHAQMYSMGDKYGVDCLRDYAAVKFNEVCVWLDLSRASHNLFQFELLLGLVPMVYELPETQAAQSVLLQDHSLRYHLVKAITNAMYADRSFLDNEFQRDVPPACGICLSCLATRHQNTIFEPTVVYCADLF